MKLFKPMSLEQAKKLYKELCDEFKKTNSCIIRIAIDDILFFTHDLTEDY